MLSVFKILLTFNVHVESLIEVENISIVANEDTIYRGNIVAVDLDGDALTYSIKTDATNGDFVLNSTNGEFTYTPAQGNYVTQNIVVTVTDGVNPQDVTIVISINQPFVIENTNLNLTTNMGDSVQLQLVVNDPDYNVIVYTISSNAQSGQSTINSQGLIYK